MQIQGKVEPKLEVSFKADIKKNNYQKKRNVFIAKFGWKMFHCYLFQGMFVVLSKNISNHLTAKKTSRRTQKVNSKEEPIETESWCLAW